jgi:epoxyqueuosine reductase
MGNGENEPENGPGKNDMPAMDDRAAWLTEGITEFCRTSPLNNLKNAGNDRIFDEPLVGFSNGADPLYGFLQRDIGAPFMTPLEIFRKSFPDSDARAEDLTVISWILPHNPATVAENAGKRFLPSERWVRAKHHGSVFGKNLSLFVVDLLRDAGHPAVAPQYTPFWKIGRSEKYGLASVWSERHAAHVSGLGTFGLCDGLITPKGKAMACGSVIARIAVPPTPREYTDHRAWCLYYANGSCGKCITRCPAKALSKKGHNKMLCFLQCMVISKIYVLVRFGINDYGCGLCQAGVPCDRRNPVRSQAKKGKDSRS